MNNSSPGKGISWDNRLPQPPPPEETFPKTECACFSSTSLLCGLAPRYCTSYAPPLQAFPTLWELFLWSLVIIPNVPLSPRFCMISSAKCCLIYDHFQLPCSSWPAGHKDSFMHWCNSHTHWHGPQQLPSIQKSCHTHTTAAIRDIRKQAVPIG